uniref:Uncharacterized protein n=1 Tax=Gossypium raimondii TaxID=29730 RepID=A0A0D2QPT8_GOSRA|nr:hypothetical protein B456_001G129600 [Gossypium raimondii]KJB09216.1 hypothetical protein B456_001G129600 [Gossypium raimondii]
MSPLRLSHTQSPCECLITTLECTLALQQRTKKRLLYDPWPWKLRFPPVGSIPPPPIQILHAKVISPIKVNLKERFMREFPLIIISRSDTVLLSCTRRF